MLVDFTQEILDLDNKQLLIDQYSCLDTNGNIIIVNGQPKMEGGRPLTLAIASADALQTPFKGEESLSGDKKLERFKLACKIHGEKLPIEVTPEEVVLIKDLISKKYAVVVYGRACDMLKG